MSFHGITIYLVHLHFILPSPKSGIKIIFTENQFPLFIVDTIPKENAWISLKRCLYLIYVIFEGWKWSQVKGSFILDDIESLDLQENGTSDGYIVVLYSECESLMDSHFSVFIATS